MPLIITDCSSPLTRETEPEFAPTTLIVVFEPTSPVTLFVPEPPSITIPDREPIILKVSFPSSPKYLALDEYILNTSSPSPP